MKPAIIISSHEAERLESIADHLPSSQTESRDALLDELGRAKIVDPDKVPAKVVAMNSTVRFAITSPYDEFRLTLAYPSDMREGADQISVLTPVGMALLGLAEGSEMKWPRPNGQSLTVKVLEVVPPAPTV